MDLVTTTSRKLFEDLDRVDAKIAAQVCVDDWTVRDLLTVRVWWTEHVIDWVEAGERDEEFDVPAPGYGWGETPALNQATVETDDRAFPELVARLREGVARVLATIERLDDRALLEPGRFAWAGKYPIARWISMNTATQYASARAIVRRRLA